MLVSCAHANLSLNGTIQPVLLATTKHSMSERERDRDRETTIILYALSPIYC